MRNLLPELGKETNRWSGQIQDTIDYCAFIGRNPGEKRTFICTGDSGQGITHGSILSGPKSKKHCKRSQISSEA